MTPAFDSVPILGVPIHNVDMAGAVDRVGELVETSRRTGRTHQVATVNTDFLVSAYRDPEIHRILQHADLAIADGMPIVWASRRMRAELPGRVAGADLVPALVERAATAGHRVMFFGGAGDSAAIAAALLRDRHPGVSLLSCTGMVDADGTAAEAQLGQLRDAAPDILCVGLGHPKQERFIVRHASALGIPVSIGTGATFEFLAGDTNRAPAWMQRTGFEWLHRMLHDPTRLVRRYATDARVFGPAFIAQMRSLGPGSGASNAAKIPISNASVAVQSIDLGCVDRLSTDEVAQLSSYATLARRAGSTVRIENCSPSVAEQLDQLHLRSLFAAPPQSSTEVTQS